jgi:hypothetical protein
MSTSRTPGSKRVDVPLRAAHDLLTLDGKLFVESCEVRVFEGDEAQQAVAEFLAGPELELAS